MTTQDSEPIEETTDRGGTADIREKSTAPSADRAGADERPERPDRTDQPANESTDSDAPATDDSWLSSNEPLVPVDAAMDLRTRWETIQQGFVDDPRRAVTDADKLVDELLQRLSATFSDQRQGLERQWSDGEPSTEDLRGALRRYRAFFERLLTI